MENKMVLKIFSAMYAGYDHIHTKRVRVIERKMGKHSSCRKGCAHCCHLLVTTTIPELIACIIEAEASGHRMEGKAREIDELFKEVQMPGLNIDIWARARHRCVFLKDDDTCACYGMRPWTCRGLTAYTPPDECKVGGNSITTKDSSLLEKWHVAIALLAKEIGLITYGFAPMPFNMIPALAYVTKGLDAANESIRQLGLDDVETTMARWIQVEATGNNSPEMEKALKWAREHMEKHERAKEVRL